MSRLVLPPHIDNLTACMYHVRVCLAIWSACISALLLSADAGQPARASLQFDRDIRPILSENCFQCHGMDPNKRKAKLRLDERGVAIEKGAIVPGSPDKSELVRRIFTNDADDHMPPAASNRHLSDEQKEILKQWIAEGAAYQKHWAFEAPVRPKLPTLKRKNWSANPIDNFILARLEAEKLEPSARAPLPKLLRRVSLDLCGLPPSAEQMQRWQAAKQPYATAVDELLASPHFGERVASDWMDIARYADTHGFNNDSLRSMWRWRDWVIEAFNKNMPYDQFVRDQLAGDLLPKPTLDQFIATGFNRNHVINSEGGIIDEEYRVEYVVDRVQTTSLAWLGLTTGCARCHDHKFDPVTQKDFYRFYAFFNHVEEYGEDGRIGNASPLLSTPTVEQQKRSAQFEAQLQAAEKQMRDIDRRSAITEADLQATVAALESGERPTNYLSLSFAANVDDPIPKQLTNSAGGEPFHFGTNISIVEAPLGSKALLFAAQGAARTKSLPKIDSGKGWSFSSWVRRDSSDAGALFSTMKFDVPASSQEYGRGVEVRFSASGALEARMASRWPAYSVNVRTRETQSVGEWHHVRVTCDGGNHAAGIRLYLDGQECLRTVLHDDLQSAAGISGGAVLGGTYEPGQHGFKGALADVKLTGKASAKASEAVGAELAKWIASMPPEKRTPGQAERLRREWLRANNKEFAAADETGRKARNGLLKTEREAPTTMVMNETETARITHVLFRGQYDQPREAVEPGVPDFLLPFPGDAPTNRLGLAKWLTDPRQPLTARVVVNRFWESLFGSGIVKSVENLGFQADWPSHPELLDWLAVEFRESGWDVKHILRLIVMSATYCQDSGSSPALNERDPENRLLAHGPRQRLTAEMLRDQALVLGSLLKDQQGGPPVYPYQPTNLYQGIIVAANYPGTTYEESKGDGLYRRSLYTFWKRTVPHPTLSTFDAPDREVCTARRLKTDTPLQALALMNDTIQLEASRRLAERMLDLPKSTPAARLRFAFQLATARVPATAELKTMNDLLEKRLAYYRAHTDDAQQLLAVGASKPPANLGSAELAAYANVASLILNLDETITRN
jgi:hypothetical protein